ncbi:MAG TPA: addiction module protein [Thermoanaerobaculia bacterium]|nr:addiction module protein [Thermoanaerobaculia bacterium]
MTELEEVLQEIERRKAEVERGEAQLIDWDLVKAEVEAELKRPFLRFLM